MPHVPQLRPGTARLLHAIRPTQLRRCARRRLGRAPRCRRSTGARQLVRTVVVLLARRGHRTQRRASAGGCSGGTGGSARVRPGDRRRNRARGAATGTGVDDRRLRSRRRRHGRGDGSAYRRVREHHRRRPESATARGRAIARGHRGPLPRRSRRPRTPSASSHRRWCRLRGGGRGHRIRDPAGTVVSDQSRCLRHPRTACRPQSRLDRPDPSVVRSHPDRSHRGDVDPHRFLPELAALWRDGRFPVDELVQTFDFTKLDDALAAVASGEVVKAVLTFDIQGNT